MEIALYIPADLKNQDPVIEYPLATYGETPSSTLEVERTFAYLLTAIVKEAFPQLKIYRELPAPGTYQLLVKANLFNVYKLDKGPPQISAQLNCKGSLEFLTADGVRITELTTESIGEYQIQIPNIPSGSLMESAIDRSSMGATELALAQLLKGLIEQLNESQEIRESLALLAEQRAQPSDLLTQIRFEDAQAVLPNQRLDAGESGEIVVTVQNKGTGAGYGVSLGLYTDVLEVQIPAVLDIGEIPPGQSREVRLPIKADLKLQDGRVLLLVEAREKRGYNARKVQLEVPTVGFQRPMLQVTDLLLDDRSGKAQGDGDGKPANGETLEATVFLRNSGPGDAGGVELVASSPSPGVEFLERTQSLGVVPAGQMRESRFLLRLPHTFEAKDLQIRIAAVEGRGESIAKGELSRSWPVLNRTPSVQLSHRIFDGNSLGSAGDRDGEINNGERVEVLLTAANRGPVEAKEVKVNIASGVGQPAVQPSTISFPDLSAEIEAPPVSLFLDVPRTFQGDRILLSLVIQQKSFPERLQEILLSVRQKLPKLSLNAAGGSNLQQGERRQLPLQLENRGRLEAKEVTVQVRSQWPGLEVLTSEVISLGSLAPDSIAASVPLELFAKRAAAVGKALLEVTVRQSDFPPLVQQIPIDITAEAPVQVEARRDLPPSVRRQPATAPSRPVIVFRKYESGQMVADEEITLALDVYDDIGLAHVGMTHNGRPVRLIPSEESANLDRATARLASRYNLPVRLSLGRNDFEVTALNHDGGKETRILSLNRSAREGQVWAAVIGISQYEDSNLNLQFADTDAEAFRSFLSNDLGVPPGNLLFLKNEQATRRKIIETIGDWLRRKAQPDDTVLLYFAGHGASEENPHGIDALEKYLLPYDAATDSYNSSAINFAELQRQINRITAARVIFVLDTCFSGAAAGGRTVFDRELRTRGVLTDGFLIDLAESGRGTILLMASNVNELAYERTELGHGVFTYYLLEGLRGPADRSPFGNGDGQINVDEAYLYTLRKVREKTKNAQNPHKFGGGSGEIVIGKTQTGDSRP